MDLTQNYTTNLVDSKPKINVEFGAINLVGAKWYLWWLLSQISRVVHLNSALYEKADPEKGYR